ncbi:hypothetical protein GmHk_03G007375 [Glycine max]|nr:hypothetical protein GmHk_03G007375 [Glycine max]
MQQPIPKCPSQPLNFHGITLKGKQDENWFQLLAPMISQWNNRVEFRVDVYPRQEGLLSFNSDYMVWYRRKNEDVCRPKQCKHNYIVSTLISSPNNCRLKLRRHYSIWCHHKGRTHEQLMIITILSEEQEIITEPVAHGPASERRFPPQEFHMLQSSVETRGFGRRREVVEAEEFS